MTQRHDPGIDPELHAVVEFAKRTRRELNDVTFRLPGRGDVTAEDCTDLAAKLRALAKKLDRHAATRPSRPRAPGSLDSASAPRTWVYPEV
ncbi:hypothetical protein AB8O55_25255 [Saccharopolyspora cebuensis]|uniref:Uncharacterized protein n=1 Tax=Saccharopolyspora cebuensis TaxID=418759 RepID=A0ABV4CRX8_9PSEU